MKNFKGCFAICLIFISYGYIFAKPTSSWFPEDDDNAVHSGDWRKIVVGNVTNVVIYRDYIYGVGTDKSVWRYSERHSQEWEKVANGSVTSISIKNGKIYGVGPDDAVWVCPINFKSPWKRITEGERTNNCFCPNKFLLFVCVSNTEIKHTSFFLVWSVHSPIFT